MINKDFITEGADILVMVAIVPANIGGGSNTGGDKVSGHRERKTLVHQTMIIGKWKRIKIFLEYGNSQ